MFARLSRSWRLVKASASILEQDKHLLVFPLMSAVAMLMVVAAFALPVLGLGALDRLDELGGKGDALVYGGAFLFYVVQYFVIFYFNAALVGATLLRLDGGSPRFGDGLRIANGRFWAILGYAVIAATVGVILRTIQERVGLIGRFIVGLLGVGWTVATYMVVPTLVATEASPVQAIQESAAMLKRTWGENVIGQAGMSLAFSLMTIAVVVVGVLLIALGVMSGHVALAALVIGMLVMAVLMLMLLHATLSGIYAAALYRYASKGEGCVGFDSTALQAAFQPKN